MPSKKTRSETCPHCAGAKTFTAIYVYIQNSQQPNAAPQLAWLWRCPTCNIVVDFDDLGQGTA